MPDDIKEAPVVQAEQVPKPVEVAIPLSERQAHTLSQMLLVRETADRELVIYAGAIIAGSDYERGEFVGVRAANGNGPAALVLRV